MKKITALLMLLVSLCTLSAAAAQSLEIFREDSLFYIEITLPEGARAETAVAEDTLSRTNVEFITAGKPSVVITATPDETYVGQSLADLTREQVELIISGVTVEMAKPAVDIRKTADGYEYIVCNEGTEANDTCDTVMLVNGYFIMVHVFYPDYSELTPADMEIGPSIVETFRFVGNTNS